MRSFFCNLDVTVPTLVAVAGTFGFTLLFEPPVEIAVGMLAVGLVTAITESVIRSRTLTRTKQPPSNKIGRGRQ